MKIAIVTDSNSGMTLQESQALSVSLLPMPFSIDGESFFEGVNLTQEMFFEKQEAGADISTSQPAPADILELWENLLKDHDQIVHIPMSSGLSNACATAKILAQEFDGRVFVVDNKRISATQRDSVLNAVKMAEQGMDGQTIRDKLEAAAMDADIYIAVNTLKYLKKGGRITPAAAAIGTALHIKPVLKISGEKLDAFAKVRGIKQAQQKMIDTARKEMNERYAGQEVLIQAAYSGDPETGRAWKELLEQEFPDQEIYCAPLALSIACHIGAGAMGITCMKKMEW